jgi:crotonobetainyl-CoA:carnitine CoA-transferase CaiB-like acyl-CoA transferase
MDQEGLTRLFGDEGRIEKKTIQRYAYDFEKIKTLLSPIGKWEDILEADEKKLRTILAEIPEPIREQIKQARSVAKEYSVISATLKKTKFPPESDAGAI